MNRAINIGPEINIRIDCFQWHGGRPCLQQLRENLSSCTACSHFEQAASFPNKDTAIYDPELLKTARRIGVIKLGGLGNILRVSAITKSIQYENYSAEIEWFSHERGVDLLRYVPGVNPHNITDSTDIDATAPSLDVLLNFECHAEAKEVVRKTRLVGGFALNQFDRFQPASDHAYRLQRFQIDDEFRKQKIKRRQYACTPRQ